MKKWTVKQPDRKTISQLMLSGKELTSLTAAVLASRGFTSMDTVYEQFETNELSDPFLLKDMEKAADTINTAIDNNEKICIYGDYDCDGIMSSVMLYIFLYENGADVNIYIPEREEGYGLNTEAVRKLADEGNQLIITVDNGIAAINEAELIYELGMHLVITDHHQTGEVLPKADAVVDPHRQDCFSPFKKLCGAGVALKLIAALDGGDYTMALEQFGDLTAIATIADIVELNGENRLIAKYGMQLIENTDRAGLMALLKISGIADKPVNSTSVSFMLAPRINSAGRFGSPKLAVKLLLTEDYEEALAVATELDTLNNQRKEAELTILSEIYNNINSNPQIIRERILFFSGKGWHHGVIGIVASRLLERFGKPCFIMSCDESGGETRGSARSFGEFSIFKALQHSADCLAKFGGHPAAGGFTVKNDMTDSFREKLLEYAAKVHPIMPVYTVSADYALTARELTLENIKGLKLLEPYGAGNETPVFMISEAQISEIIPLSKGAHTKFRISLNGSSLDALLFRTSPNDVSVQKGDVCNFIVTLDINSFRNNESISIIVKDYRRCGIKQSSVFAANDAFEKFTRGETLPAGYYRSMLPSYDDVKQIYLKISENGITLDNLYSILETKGINYCKLLAAVDALSELNLIAYDYSHGRLTKLKVTKKADLQSATILKALKKATE